MPQFAGCRACTLSQYHSRGQWLHTYGGCILTVITEFVFRFICNQLAFPVPCNMLCARVSLHFEPRMSK